MTAQYVYLIIFACAAYLIVTDESVAKAFYYVTRIFQNKFAIFRWWLVNITLRTLTSETQNFLYSTLFDRQNIVTVTDSYNFLNTAQREFARSFNEVNLLSQINSNNPADQSGAQALGRAAAAGL